MSKPVFLWWAHKELWNIIAHNPEMDTEEVLAVLHERHPNLPPLTDVVADGFACRCSQNHSIGDDFPCSCRFCPLDWGILVGNGNCFPLGTPFSHFLWARTKGDLEDMSMYAAQVRDIPLRKDVHSLYVVEETP